MEREVKISGLLLKKIAEAQGKKQEAEIALGTTIRLAIEFTLEEVERDADTKVFLNLERGVLILRKPDAEPSAD